jgi:hypothetical protein
MSASTLLLYRHILKAAARFPSKNRLGLIKEIKVEFREAREISDATELKKKIHLAKDGLDRMRAFSGASPVAEKMYTTQPLNPIPPPPSRFCSALCSLFISLLSRLFFFFFNFLGAVFGFYGYFW